MNDYGFGNRLYELRKKRGLSQAALAGLLGVTDKAVSKWETGRAKPATDTLRRLAELLGTGIEELLTLREESKNMKITKIVVTGGPCAGKTTGLSWIQNAFAARGYRVLFVPETATELISNGVAPWTCGSWRRKRFSAGPRKPWTAGRCSSSATGACWITGPICRKRSFGQPWSPWALTK